MQFENVKRGDRLRASDFRDAGSLIARSQQRPTMGAGVGFVRAGGGTAETPDKPPFFLARINGRVSESTAFRFAFAEYWLSGDGPPVPKPAGRRATFEPRNYAVSTVNDAEIAVGDIVIARRHPTDPALWEIIFNLGPWTAYSGSATPAADLVTINFNVVTNVACVGGQLQITTKTVRITGSELSISVV